MGSLGDVGAQDDRGVDWNCLYVDDSGYDSCVDVRDICVSVSSEPYHAAVCVSYLSPRSMKRFMRYDSLCVRGARHRQQQSQQRVHAVYVMLSCFEYEICGHMRVWSCVWVMLLLWC